MTTFQALEGFERLTDVVFLYKPRLDPDFSIAPTPSRNPEPPDLILLAAWMGASPRHILKYTSTYQSLFPLAQIILIVNAPSDIMCHSVSAQRKRVQPAVQIIQSASSTVSGQEPKILLQTMSNGGAYQISKVAEVYKDAEGLPLPVNAIIIDSAPGKDSISGGTRAILVGLPKSKVVQAIGTIVLYSLMVLSMVAQALTWQDPFVEQLRKNLVNKNLFSSAASRCYIYSKADEMVRWEDVREHALEASAMGWPNVEQLVFDSSPHCGHVRGQEQEYWNAVLATWRAGA